MLFRLVGGATQSTLTDVQRSGRKGVAITHIHAQTYLGILKCLDNGVSVGTADM